LDKHQRTPLSSLPSTSDLLAAEENNGKYAIKSGELSAIVDVCKIIYLINESVGYSYLGH